MPARLSLEQVRTSFWSRVARGDQCWEWKSHLTAKGYGRFSVHQRHFGQRCVLAHRLAWLLEHGAIPGDRDVCHHCDNRKCVRLDHLYLGTHQQNMDDRTKRGRHVAPCVRGSRHGHAKLTEAKVIQMRSRHAAGETIQTVATEFGISYLGAWKVIRRHLWKHVETA